MQIKTRARGAKCKTDEIRLSSQGPAWEGVDPDASQHLLQTFRKIRSATSRSGPTEEGPSSPKQPQERANLSDMKRVTAF